MNRKIEIEIASNGALLTLPSGDRLVFSEHAIDELLTYVVKELDPKPGRYYIDQGMTVPSAFVTFSTPPAPPQTIADDIAEPLKTTPETKSDDLGVF